MDGTGARDGNLRRFPGGASGFDVFSKGGLGFAMGRDMLSSSAHKWPSNSNLKHVPNNVTCVFLFGAGTFFQRGVPLSMRQLESYCCLGINNRNKRKRTLLSTSYCFHVRSQIRLRES